MSCSMGKLHSSHFFVSMSRITSYATSLSYKLIRKLSKLSMTINGDCRFIGLILIIPSNVASTLFSTAKSAAADMPAAYVYGADPITCLISAIALSSTSYACYGVRLYYLVSGKDGRQMRAILSCWYGLKLILLLLLLLFLSSA